MFASGDGRVRVECRFESDTIWLSQAAMAELYDKDVRTINEHLINIFSEGELVQNSTIRKFRIVRQEGKRQVSREIDHYNLEAILAVGYRVSLASRHAIPPVGHPDASGIPDQRFCDGR
ncbi:putative RhuM-like cytoplasmic protein [Escherichia coli]|uniref:Putative RhuM-like cytoplasmic protein n=1 Tax=Escherichia coli TaxID=562 RepID=A0A377JXI1_ECOLX|nr:putative RhuM-like cytoplasmic protein [Escherichia coli]